MEKGNITRIVNGKKYHYRYKNIMLKEQIWDKLKVKADFHNISIPELINNMIDKENGKI